jgi:hypothetical protein
MELFWNKPKCDKCKHKANIRYSKQQLGKEWAWDCRARQMPIENNSYYKRMNNCWYFEKK